MTSQSHYDFCFPNFTWSLTGFPCPQSQLYLSLPANIQFYYRGVFTADISWLLPSYLVRALNFWHMYTWRILHYFPQQYNNWISVYFIIICILEYTAYIKRREILSASFITITLMMSILSYTWWAVILCVLSTCWKSVHLVVFQYVKILSYFQAFLN